MVKRMEGQDIGYWTLHKDSISGEFWTFWTLFHYFLLSGIVGFVTFPIKWQLKLGNSRL